MTASAATKIRTDPSPTNRWFISGTTYASIIFCGAAVFYGFFIGEPVAHVETAGVFLNLIAFAVTGVIMSIFSYIESHELKKTSILYHRMVLPVLVTIGSILFLTMLIASRLITNQFIFLIAGYFVGSIAVVSYIYSGYVMYSIRNTDSVHDYFRLGVAFVILAVASINHMLLLPSPSSMWAVSMSLMGISFLYANVATSYTFLLNVGVRKNLAYGVTLILSAIVIVPFISARILDGIFSTSTITDIGVRIIIHAAAAILAGSAAYSYHERIKYRSSPGHMWIVILLLFWTIAEISLVVLGIITPDPLGHLSKVPYVCGAIVSAVVIPISVKRTLNPQNQKKPNYTKIYSLTVFASISMVIAGEILRNQLIGSIGSATTSAIGAGIMLSLSYVSLFAILTYILLMASASGGKLSLDTLGSGFAAIWVVITILKVNYETWTIGWWAAEIIMVISIIAFTLISVRIFTIDTNRAERREKRAVAISRFLSEQISLRQTSAIDSLSSISMDSTTGDSVLGSVSNALSDMSRANELSKYMEIFISGKEFEVGQIGPVSLRDSLYSALECAGLSSTKDSIQIGPGVQSLELKMEHDCSVQANSFLVDAFRYLLEGISNRIGQFKDLLINISESKDPHLYCICEMRMDVRVEEPDDILGLFERYVERDSLDAVEIAYSKSIVRLFGGSMSLNASVTGEKIVSIVVDIRLRKI